LPVKPEFCLDRVPEIPVFCRDKIVVLVLCRDNWPPMEFSRFKMVVASISIAWTACLMAHSSFSSIRDSLSLPLARDFSSLRFSRLIDEDSLFDFSLLRLPLLELDLSELPFLCVRRYSISGVVFGLSTFSTGGNGTDSGSFAGIVADAPAVSPG